MKVTVLLADKGTRDRQKATLNLLNAGWTSTRLQPPTAALPGPLSGMSLTSPHAVAVFYEVEPHLCNKQIQLMVELVTEDGKPVELPGPAGPQEMRLAQMITIQSPGGVPPGSPGTGNTLLEIFPGLPLTPGVYEWRVTLADRHEGDWRARFHVTPPAQPAALGFVPPTPAQGV